MLYRKRELEDIRRIIKKNKKGDRIKMVEIAKHFIGKECIIYLSSGQIIATIREVTGSALLVTNQKGCDEAVNIDYIVRICDPPRNKKGQIKAIY